MVIIVYNVIMWLYIGLGIRRACSVINDKEQSFQLNIDDLLSEEHIFSTFYDPYPKTLQIHSV